MTFRLWLVTKRWNVNIKVHVPTSWLIVFVMGDINLIVQFITPFFN